MLVNTFTLEDVLLQKDYIKDMVICKKIKIEILIPGEFIRS